MYNFCFDKKILKRAASPVVGTPLCVSRIKRWKVSVQLTMSELSGELYPFHFLYNFCQFGLYQVLLFLSGGSQSVLILAHQRGIDADALGKLGGVDEGESLEKGSQVVAVLHLGVFPLGVAAGLFLHVLGLLGHDGLEVGPGFFLGQPIAHNGYAVVGGIDAVAFAVAFLDHCHNLFHIHTFHYQVPAKWFN